MEVKVFSIFDEKSLVYTSPFHAVHKGEAIRSFSDLVTDNQTRIAKHPGDYKLYMLGTYDDVAGQYKSLTAPEFIAHAVDFLPSEKK